MTDATNTKSDCAHAPARLHPAGAETKASSSRAPSERKASEKPTNAAPREKRQTKALNMEAMLSRKSGATLDQMGEATGWQVHTCRAFMSGLRKKGREIVRETGKAGKSIYRFGSSNSAAKAG